jgi:hypothetical protein
LHRHRHHHHHSHCNSAHHRCLRRHRSHRHTANITITTTKSVATPQPKILPSVVVTSRPTLHDHTTTAHHHRNHYNQKYRVHKPNVLPPSVVPSWPPPSSPYRHQHNTVRIIPPQSSPIIHNHYNQKYRVHNRIDGRHRCRHCHRCSQHATTNTPRHTRPHTTHTPTLTGI